MTYSTVHYILLLYKHKYNNLKLTQLQRNVFVLTNIKVLHFFQVEFECNMCKNQTSVDIKSKLRNNFYFKRQDRLKQIYVKSTHKSIK